VSSTDNPGDGAQQDSSPIAENAETVGPEVTDPEAVSEQPAK
jgi:hypothetical protein